MMTLRVMKASIRLPGNVVAFYGGAMAWLALLQRQFRTAPKRLWMRLRHGSARPENVMRSGTYRELPNS
jgi:hypothetical protein